MSALFEPFTLKGITLRNRMLQFPLVLYDPQACERHARQVERMLRRFDREPLIAEQVAYQRA